MWMFFQYSWFGFPWCFLDLISQGKHGFEGNLVRIWFEIYLSQRDKPDLIAVLLIVSQLEEGGGENAVIIVVNTDLFCYNLIIVLFYNEPVLYDSLIGRNRSW